jgi:protein TonB
MFNELDPVIFENRNKEYGAYRIRKAYPRLVANALLLVSSLAVIFFLLVFSYYYFKDDSIVFSGELLANYEAMDLDLIQLDRPPEIPEPPRSMETILEKENPLVEPKVTPEKEIDETENKITPEINDSLHKRGEHTVIKNPDGEGSDSGAVYVRVERFPEFPGGRSALDKYLRDNIKYGNNTGPKKVGGLVHVSFMVSSNGKVERVKVTRSLNPVYDSLAVRAVRGMPPWSPGRRLGKPVNVLITLPVRFVASG